MLFADDHPDPINVAEEANRPQLLFVRGTRFRHEGDDVLSKGLRPGAGAFPLIHEDGKGICPADRQGCEFIRSLTIGTSGLPLFHRFEGLTDLGPRDGLKVSVKRPGPWLSSLPEFGPFGGGLFQTLVQGLFSPLGWGWGRVVRWSSAAARWDYL